MLKYLPQILNDISFWFALPIAYLMPFLYCRYRYQIAEIMRLIGGIVLGVPWIYTLAVFFYTAQKQVPFPEDGSFWPTAGLVLLWIVLSVIGIVIGENAAYHSRSR